MGCSASKPISYPEISSSPSPCRAFSLPTPLIHHPPLKKGDTHHLVSLTSTSYGSLLLIDPSPNFTAGDLSGHSISDHSEPTLSPDSVVNTWELMEGLDDLDLSLQSPNKLPSPSPTPIPIPIPTSSSVKPLWQHLSEEALLAKLDPEVVFSYRRALSSRQLGSDNSHCKSLKSMDSSSPLSCRFPSSLFRLSGSEDKVVIYFTSLRGIRKTYEDCCSIRTIFKGFRVAVDERDISMDSSYRKELQTALGKKIVNLPQVFIKGKYIGGAEEIKQLNEFGELSKLLMGFPVWDFKSECERCGDARFLPCLNCYGSKKVFEEEEGELKRCPQCNENGLIKCPKCCS